ncbi:glucose 1-dehydrogenase [Sphingomonas aliaeris]|uniref:Glucose 1-dehydrogenase n=1 Tax=Sphingomonas aliaeris TaxID=2759526 RepID=A0A974S4N9_9SPHN|nr:glucose 1-dehydrogenase [Sphingomonas aliaeris]QQV77649.1 glucose 1-dehydrogenase [Sphingomonas aliaeris]
MSGKLDGRVAIVTGASRGQGEATARLFAEHGARVVVADVTDEGRSVAATIGANAVFAKLDVSDADNWQAVVTDTVARWGGIDVLINNAGINRPAALLDLEQGVFEQVLAINLIGPWLGMKSVAPVMIEKGKGSIVNIVSSSGLFGLNGLAAYTSSKWALRGLTKTAALELGHRGVRVNSVYPGGINTPMGNITDEPVENLGKYYTGQPIQRIGEPIEVARVSLFLASDDSSYMCGSELAVDGGQTIGTYTPFLPGAPEA